MKTIGILKCGAVPEELRDTHGDYETMFTEFLGPEFSYKIFDVENNQLPSAATEASGWLITGSRHGAYESHPWIPPLEQLLRDAYSGSIPIVGVCFGHQILAQALGGQVEKFSGGWSVGPVAYKMEGEDKPSIVNAMHQDQVIEPPADAVTIGSTDFCKYAVLSYGNKALTIQPHPEFNSNYTRDLVEFRRDQINNPELVDYALSNSGQSLSQKRWAQQFRQFFSENAV